MKVVYSVVRCFCRILSCQLLPYACCLSARITRVPLSFLLHERPTCFFPQRHRELTSRELHPSPFHVCQSLLPHIHVPIYVLILIPLPSPSNATLTLPIPWRIPNTSTSLQLRLGLPVRPGLLRRFLAFVEDQVEEEIIVLGVDAPLPEDGYDCEYYDLEFSAYSPPEPGHTGRMTWGLLLTIIEGLSVYLHDQSRNREAFFKVMDGPEDFFVGYGHLVLQRYLA